MKICLICGIESEFPVCETCAKTKVGRDTLKKLKAKALMDKNKITFKQTFFILFLLLQLFMIIIWMVSQ